MINIKNKLSGQYLFTKDTFDPKKDMDVDKKHRLSKFEWFCIKHYATNVVYNVEGFVEKNKDQINPEFLRIMEKSN